MAVAAGPGDLTALPDRAALREDLARAAADDTVVGRVAIVSPGVELVLPPPGGSGHFSAWQAVQSEEVS